MEPNLKYEWQQLVLDAFMEMRSEQLPEKINIAERAISARLCDSQVPDSEEQTALRDALQSLRVLIKEVRSKEVDERKLKASA